MQCYVSFRATAHRCDDASRYSVLSTRRTVATCPYYHPVPHMACAPRVLSDSGWKRTSHPSLRSIRLLPRPSPLATTSSSMSTSLFVCFLDSICKRKHVLFVFLCLPLSIRLSRSIHVANGKISLFYGEIIFHHTYTSCLSIYLLMGDVPHLIFASLPGG